MASSQQFEAFKFFFVSEDERAASLTDKGKTYLTLISLFFAYLGYRITDNQFDQFIRLKFASFSYGFFLYALVFVCLLAGLASTLLSLFMHDYEDIADPEKLFDRVLREELSDEQFFDLLIADMNVTTKINAAVSDKRALELQIASYSLFAGFLMYGGVFLISAWCRGHSC
jgi:hypothetical protein